MPYAVTPRSGALRFPIVRIGVIFPCNEIGGDTGAVRALRGWQNGITTVRVLERGELVWINVNEVLKGLVGVSDLNLF